VQICYTAIAYWEPFMRAAVDRLLTARQVADLLGVSVASVLRRWRAGELPGFRLSTNCLRFRESEIAGWLEARRGPAGGSTIRPIVSEENG
jgi:excisionase family DNA binding protein